MDIKIVYRMTRLDIIWSKTHRQCNIAIGCDYIPWEILLIILIVMLTPVE